MSVKLMSWNVNGIRAILKKGFENFIEERKPDILCLQETKAHPDQLTLELEGYWDYWNAAEKKGYSGVAVFTKKKPLDVFYGIGIEKHDSEGRVITLEFESCYLVNVYTPNSQNGLKRLSYRAEQWDVDFLNFLVDLEKKKPVIFCGDLNVAHKEIDLANPKTNVKNAGFTSEERAGFDRIVEAGFIDTFRKFDKSPHQYTWWSYRTKARERNVGWRIDYFCASPKLDKYLKNAKILSDVMGSDHCPILLEVENLF